MEMTEFSLSSSQLHDSNQKQKVRTGTQTTFSCIDQHIMLKILTTPAKWKVPSATLKHVS